MRTILRNFVLVPVAMAAALATTAMAATTLTIPFNFSIAGKNCPAGTYSVERVTVGSNVVKLRSQDARNSFTWTLGPGAPAPSDTRVVLSFDEFGHQHALRSVQFGSLIKSSLDKNAGENERASMRIVQGQ